MSMIGYNLYLLNKGVDPQTGESWEDEPYFLRLSYGSPQEANDARIILEKVYGEGSIDISVKSTGIPEIGE